MKIIIWGLPLHTHTHSYIHHAFYRAATQSGYETHWVPDDPKSNDVLQAGDIVISCGIADSNLNPVNGVKYILHNSSRNDIRQLQHINLQVYTHDVLNRDCQNLGNLTFWQNSNKTLYQPWATDLLPNEIAKISPIEKIDSSKDVIWIGSITTGEQGNYQEASRYSELCQKNGIKFSVGNSVSLLENIQAIRSSRHAPALQGKWQVEKGYIPCRIFKNISYGRMSFTNSETVGKLLDIPYHLSIDDLYEASEKDYMEPNLLELQKKMKLIAEKHTYLNRLQNIINFIKEAT